MHLSDRRILLRGFAALPLLGTAGALLVATSAIAQQGPGPGGGPPLPGPTRVEAGELVETWNGRVSAGPPIHVFPVFDGWSMGTAMPLPRSEHAIAQMDGKIWVLGGYPPGRLPSNLVQVYDSATGRWTLGPRLPQPIHHTHAAAVRGKLYVLGGEIDGASTGKPETFVSNVWMHDPAVGGWVARSPMPTPRGGGGKAMIDGKIYVAGTPAWGPRFRGLRPGDRHLGKASRHADPA